MEINLPFSAEIGSTVTTSKTHKAHINWCNVNKLAYNPYFKKVQLKIKHFISVFKYEQRL